MAQTTAAACNADISLADLVKNNMKIEKIVYPDEKAKLYELQYAKYRKIYPALKSIYAD